MRQENDISIELAAPSDARSLNRYMREIYAEAEHLITHIDEFKSGSIRQRFWITNKIANPLETCILAKSKGRIIGMLDSYTDKRRRVRHVTTFAMSVALSHRGLGVGRALLNHFITWVKGHEILRKIELHVHADNDYAIRLYESVGFEEEGRRKGAICYEDGSTTDDIIMGLWVREEKA